MTEQKKSRKQYFGTLRMSTKITLSGGVLIFCSNLLILFIVCLSAIYSLRGRVQEQGMNRLNLVDSTVSGIIADTGKLMLTISTTGGISSFVTDSTDSPSETLKTMNSIHEKLHILVDSSSDVDYAALVRMDNKKPMYVGREIPGTEVYWKLLYNGIEVSDTFEDGISVNLLLDVYRDPEINLFCPVFEEYSLNRQLVAFLVVGINASSLKEGNFQEDVFQKIRVIDEKGKILVSSDLKEIGSRAEQYQGLSEKTGRYEEGDTVVMYQSSGTRNLIFEGTMSKDQWYESILRTAAALSFVILLFTLISIVMIYSLSSYFYEPMEEMLSVMRKVGEGDLNHQMKQYEQSDFGQIAGTFNSMTDSLKGQMEMIRQKEQENTEIRLNALQSQIKPHFLYNTLESIHWQALLEGATGVSKMIMALSRFYRLCLSKGEELIPLSTELEHMKSYVMIQNIRFDDILQMEYDIPEELNSCYIPKITLQPLVENAFYHGIKPKNGVPGHVRITGALEEGYMILRISDDGVGMTKEQIQELNDNINILINDGSYGVKNVHTRLEIRYGKGSGLHYEKNPEGGITVTVRLPARKAM
ncbi:MAG: sensor histidine kinase [Lachnospiraceae bacterium]|nr:sensor histidine kinase [Lachnospiraceae bacterium]